ncbi:right-handed parallel beta-helix repeat-containing protein [Litorilituus lipolyticus]|nr:right-handed parallel beta-helix repeat-containing protein [Litorilituus lipolyticus]
MRFFITLLYLLIAYGSLFPFDFSLIEFNQNYHHILRFKLTSLGDTVANIALFAPLGLFYGLMNNYISQPLLNSRLLLKVAFFAIILQLLQIALPTRDQNIVDVIFNLAGFVVGYYAVFILRLPNQLPTLKLQHLPIAIGLLYILSELVPFVPSIDFQAIKDSIKPLLLWPGVDVVWPIIFSSVLWLLTIRLFSFQCDYVPVKRAAQVWLFMIVAKILVYGVSLSYVDLIAPLIAIMLASFLTLQGESFTKLLLSVVLACFLTSSMASFGDKNITLELFIPFHGYLSGHLAVAVQGVLFKLFLFSAVIWLAFELMWPVKKVALLLGALVLTIELAQLFMPSKTTDFADVLLVYLAYRLVRNLGDFLASHQEAVADNSVALNTKKQVSLNINMQPTRLKQIIIFSGVFFLLYLGINTLFSLSALPTNVVELFRHQGSLTDVFFFFIFLIIFATSSALIVRYLTEIDTVKVSQMLILHFALLFCCFVALSLAVTFESIEDIVGSAKLPQLLYKHQTSEHFGMVLVKVFSLTNIAIAARYLEFSFRFIFLVTLIQTPLTLWLLISHSKLSAASKLKATCVSFALIILAYLVVFTFAVTDNLTELIASPLLFVVALMLLTVSTVYSIIQIKKGSVIQAIIVTCLFAGLSWFLAQYVFETVIIKYGHVFSAFDFILAGSREDKIVTSALMIRWSIGIFLVQWVFILGYFWLESIKSIKVNRAAIPLIKKGTVVVLAIACIVYVGNRLFGEQLHWQTLQQHFANTHKQNYAIDSSTAYLPKTITAGQVFLNNEPMVDLKSAFELAQDGDFIRLSTGFYQQAAILKASNVSIIAEKGAVLFGKTVEGKGAIVIKGDNTYIEGLECHSIYVPDNNGVCVRLEGKGLTLNNVYFHHAQGGLLGSPKGGDIRIEQSRFEHLGDGAFYHGIYTLERTRLFINNSYFLNNRNAGHEIKSRSSHTEIVNSTIAASQSRDSRLVDVPNGGVFVLRDNLLVEGIYSENHDLLSWGVEGVKHSTGSIIIENNVFISDKAKARLISLRDSPKTLRVVNNIVIGQILGFTKEDNLFFTNRAEASLPRAPQLPLLSKEQIRKDKKKYEY